MPAETKSPVETVVSNGHTIATKDNKQQPAHAMFTTTTYPSRALHFLTRLPDEHHANGASMAAMNGNANGVTKPAVSEDNVPGQLKLEILVVGAGLGGLATAIALGRRGFSVQVFEQAATLGEVRDC